MQVKVDKNGENRVGTCVGVGGMGMVRCGGGARVRGGGAVGRRIGVDRYRCGYVVLILKQTTEQRSKYR